MIPILDDAYAANLEPLNQLLAELPNPPSPATAHRWIHKGKRGVKLPALDLSGQWYSTRDAVNAFVRATSEPREAHPSPPTTDVRNELATLGLVSGRAR